MMQRRQFIQYGLAFTGLAAGLQSCKGRIPVNGTIAGASSEIGHLLRDKSFSNPVKSGKKKVVIVGGGVSGLSAARQLQKNNINDFILLELESHTGGNASNGSNSISAFPMGAHYVPIPNNNLTEYLDFLKEAGVITSFDEKGLPVYNEFHLCFDPEERLYINGRWQEGLVPHFGVPEKELAETKRFLEQMQAFRTTIGKDGKEAFAIPVNQSSNDPEFSALDQITMKEWLLANGYKSDYLHWYVNYCSRDDFGTPYEKCSAWAGIHYYAGRKGKASNASYSDVLTWPEGNGFLVNKLAASFSSHIATGCLATKVETTETGCLVSYLDTQTRQQKQWEADYCILAVPQFIASRLLNDITRKEAVHKNVHYVPWMVANLLVNNWVEKNGAPLSWDNVLYESRSLGYVNATQQLMDATLKQRNLTYYLPLTENDPETDRKTAQQYSHADWVEIIMKDLEKTHPDIRDKTEEVTIQLWGHAMAQPRTDWIKGSLRSSLSRPIGKMIQFAHTDIAGISIFEEGFYQGITAANTIIHASI